MRIAYVADPKDETGSRKFLYVDGRRVGKAWAYERRGRHEMYVHGSALRERLLGMTVAELPASIDRLRLTLPNLRNVCPHTDGITILRREPRLRFDFQIWMEDWKGDWTILDYMDQLRQSVLDR